jgi:excisionase family DNA binding protein
MIEKGGKMGNEKQRMRTIKELAEGLGMHAQVIWRYCRDGRIDAVKVGGRWRIPETVFEGIVRGDIQVRPCRFPARCVTIDEVKNEND